MVISSNPAILHGICTMMHSECPIFFSDIPPSITDELVGSQITTEY